MGQGVGGGSIHPALRDGAVRQLEQEVTIVLDEGINAVLVNSEWQLELKFGHAWGFG